MKQTWKNIKEKITNLSPQIAESFNEPADLNEIKTLEDTIGQTLPDSFTEYLKCYNGQDHNNYDISFVGGSSLITVNEIIKIWKMQVEDFGFSDDIIEHIEENKIQAKIWDRGWIPFADFMGHQYLILDLNPGKNGVYGQVLQLWTGIDMEEDSVVVANSFEEFSQRVLDSLDSNNCELTDETIELKDDWII